LIPLSSDADRAPQLKAGVGFLLTYYTFTSTAMTYIGSTRMTSKGQQRNPLPFLGRGALGGLFAGFGALLWSVFLQPYILVFILEALPMALGLGALVGVLVGFSVWVVSVISSRKFGILGRAIIGFVTALIIMTAYASIHVEEPGYSYPILSWTRQAVNWTILGLVFGALPGIMARQKSAASKLTPPTLT
jgi:hypothetical protein